MKSAFPLVFVLLSFILTLNAQDIPEESQLSTEKKFETINLTEKFKTEKLVFGLEGRRDCAISFDGHYLGLYFVDAMAKIYRYKLMKIQEDGLTEIELEGGLSGLEYFDNSIGFSKDSKYFYVLTTNMEIYIWSTDDGRLVKELQGHKKKDDKSTYAFIPNGVIEYDPASDRVSSEGFILFGSKMYIFHGDISEPFEAYTSVIKLAADPSVVAFSKNNKMMAIAGVFSKKANLYDTQTGQIKGMVTTIKKGINSMCFMADDESIILSEKFFMTKPNSTSGSSTTLFGLDKSSYDMDVNCNNILAYDISPSGDLKIWDLNKDKELATLSNLFKLTFTVIFSYDGTYLYAISAHGEVIQWEIEYL